MRFLQAPLITSLVIALRVNTLEHRRVLRTGEATHSDACEF